MNLTNQTLTAQEQINLRLNQDNKEDDDMASGRYKSTTDIDDMQVYSLEDIFNMPEEAVRHNVYEVIKPFNLS